MKSINNNDLNDDGNNVDHNELLCIKEIAFNSINTILNETGIELLLHDDSELLKLNKINFIELTKSILMKFDNTMYPAILSLLVKPGIEYTKKNINLKNS
jgi:hypothetical protein